MNIKPLHEFVLIVKDALSEKTEGGIIISPEKDDSTTRTGIVMAIGNDVDSKWSGIAKKKRVLFNKYAGIALKDNQLLLKEEEILAIVEDVN
jgi:co-chaperonin GroES (HSP10)